MLDEARNSSERNAGTHKSSKYFRSTTEQIGPIKVLKAYGPTIVPGTKVIVSSEEYKDMVESILKAIFPENMSNYSSERRIPETLGVWTIDEYVQYSIDLEAEQSPPNSLFDPQAYRENLAEQLGDNLAVVTHYINTGTD